MKMWKRIISLFLFILIAITLCSCGESDEAKLSRLQNEAAQKRQAATEAQNNYNKLKSFLGN